MAMIRNVSGEARAVPWEGRIVDDGEVLAVPVEDVWAYTQQAGVWEPADEAAQAVHDEAGTSRPRGNASREEWVRWVVAKGLAAEQDLENLTRDELRDTYGQEG